MKYFAIALLVLFTTACDVASPTGASSVQYTDSKYFRIFPQNGLTLSADIVAYADTTWEETARCLDFDPNKLGGVNLWVYPQEDLSKECGQPANGCTSYSRMRITADYQKFDQGWRHEFVHLYLYRTGGNQDHVTGDALNEHPWKCQFYWHAQ